MDERWQKVREVFDSAIRRAPEERQDFVAQACSDDHSLLIEVESLLSSLDSASGFLESPVSLNNGDDEHPPVKQMEPGTSFGHYEITERIGEGGMGEVFVARDTDLDRKVALKLLSSRITEDKNRVTRFRQEAFATSALNHPNIVTIFEIGKWEGRDFIVTELINGVTLRELLRKKKLSIETSLDIAVQIASALAAAHGAGVVHRDIKPENIMVRKDGLVKVLDFGIAKYRPVDADRKALIETSAGEVIGTAAYMSPEQARGLDVDARTDVWSLGVILYEMIAGKLPFEGSTRSDRVAAILDRDPPPLGLSRAKIPADLEQLIKTALEKDRDDRYRDISSMAEDIQRLLGTTGGKSHSRLLIAPRSRRGLHYLYYGAICAVGILVVPISGYWLWHSSRLDWAKSQVPHIEEFAKSGKYFEAFDLASQVQGYLPGDPNLAALMPTISDTLTVNSEPAGAQVYLKRYQPDEDGHFPERRLIGTTPVSGLRIARGAQIVYIEKEGHAPVQTVISSRLIRFASNLIFNPTPTVEISRKLLESRAVPEKMTFVSGGEYRLASSTRPTDNKVKLDDYFIDKFEVTNKDYKEFISAGGYLRQEYWKVPVVKDSRTLSWNEAMSLFRDRTGLPAPREWSNQDFPADKAAHPVTGVTWYEAAAFAEFKGKKLPTVFQWEKAARNGEHQDASYKMPWGDLFPGDSIKHRANFEDPGTVPVDSHEFGISEFGAFNMAGNVSEWVLNQGVDGYFATGGAWGEPVYTFSYFGDYPGLFASSKRGFRCVRLLTSEQSSGDQGGAMFQRDLAIPNYPRTTDAQFRELSRSYDYAKTPLDAEVLEVTETADWRREKIAFNGAGGERAIAYLYLPRSAAPPYQVVQILPGSDVDNGVTAVSVGVEGWLGSVIKAGRALLAVVVKGNSERPWPDNFKKPGYDSVEYRDLLVNRYTDHRRGLDYLETRNDIDIGRLGFVGISSGASTGLILPAVETRYRSVFLSASGLPSYFMTNKPDANPINFASHIRQPKFVLNGRFDENYPGKTVLEPMLKLFPEPKELELYEGPHAPRPEVLIPAINKYFDRTLGPVRRQ